MALLVMNSLMLSAVWVTLAVSSSRALLASSTLEVWLETPWAMAYDDCPSWELTVCKFFATGRHVATRPVSSSQYSYRARTMRPISSLRSG